MTKPSIQKQTTDTNHSYQSITDQLISTPPEIASEYTFIRQLGQGTQGTVYLAKRNNDNLEVAIKRLDIDSVQNWKEYDLFHREAEVLQNLNINGVARFYEAPEFLDIEHPAAYIVQEFVDGQSLEEMIQSGFRFTLNRLFKWVLKILDILETLHTHEPPIIHRDLKPNNIIMKPLSNGDFQPYLIDFGAVANPQVQSGGSTVAGTYGYMPPEQLMGKPVPASDIYSLAATIAYIMSGVTPGEMQITDFHLIIEPHLENIPNIVIATLHQMLEPKIDKRLVDYSTLRERFDMFAAGKYEFSGDSIKELDENQLFRVQKLGQRGNIDLWMALPDNTPRVLPDIYKSLNPYIQSDKRIIYPKLRKRFLLQSILNIIVVMILLGGLPLGLIVLIMNNSTNVNFMAWLILFAMSIALFVVMIYCIFYSIKLTNSKLHKIYSPKTMYYNDYKSKDTGIDLSMLLEHGTKSIATVIDLSYTPAELSSFEIYQMDKEQEGKQLLGKYTLSEGESTDLGYCHTYARYRLRYRFNPPDDDNPDDLVHEIYLHHDMTDVLHAGVPLPILYYINPRNKLDVMSIPFPYPFNDIASLNDLYYKPSFHQAS